MKNNILIVILAVLIALPLFFVFASNFLGPEEKEAGVFVDGEKTGAGEKDLIIDGNDNLFICGNFLEKNLDIEINNKGFKEFAFSRKKEEGVADNSNNKAVFAIGESKYRVNEEIKEQNGVSPFVSEDYRIMFPFKIVGEELGIEMYWLQDEYRLEVFERKEPYEVMDGLITFILDDGTKEQYEKLYPLFKEKDVVANLSPATVYLGDLEGFAEWEMVDEVYEQAGWEISSHTSSHPNLTELEKEDVQVELKASKEALEKYDPVSLVYPYYQYDDNVLRYTQKYYEIAFAGSKIYSGRPTGSSGAGDEANVNTEEYIEKNRYELKRVTLTDSEGEWVGGENKESLYRLVDKAQEMDGWLVFALHNADDYSMKRLEDLINYIKKEGPPVGTSYEGIDKFLEGSV